MLANFGLGRKSADWHNSSHFCLSTLIFMNDWAVGVTLTNPEHLAGRRPRLPHLATGAENKCLLQCAPAPQHRIACVLFFPCGPECPWDKVRYSMSKLSTNAVKQWPTRCHETTPQKANSCHSCHVSQQPLLHNRRKQTDIQSIILARDPKQRGGRNC